MARISWLLPDARLVRLAAQLAENYGLEFVDIKQISMDSAIQEGKLQQSQNVDIIIARGAQAELIRRALSIPVVSIQMSAMEMGDLILKGMELQDKNLHIAFISPPATAQDLFNIQRQSNHFNVKISLYPAVTKEEHRRSVERGMADGANVFVGGATVERLTKEFDLSYIQIQTGEESLLSAYGIASEIAHAIDSEKKHNEELRTYLDYSTNGTLKIDRSGVIQFCNHYVERLLRTNERMLNGKNITDVFPELNESMLERMFQDNKDIYIRVTVGTETISINILPVTVKNQAAQRALVFLHDSTRIQKVQDSLHPRQSGHYIPRYTFDNLPNVSKAFAAAKEKAKLVANFSSVFHISGSFGTEKRQLAEAIHNANQPGGRPFRTIYCSYFSSQVLSPPPMGFGDQSLDIRSVLDASRGSTLFLDAISQLPAIDQHVVYQVIEKRIAARSSSAQNGDGTILITGDKTPLTILYQQGKIIPAMYYLLTSVVLSIPPMSERIEDVEIWIESFLQEEMERYGRYIKLTQDAHKVIRQHTWTGGLHEIRAFVRSLIFTSPRRSVDAALAQSCLVQNAPFSPNPRQGSQFEYDPQAERIVCALRAANGSRVQAAQQLGISTTTLWRSIKKYGLTKEDWL